MNWNDNLASDLFGADVFQPLADGCRAADVHDRLYAIRHRRAAELLHSGNVGSASDAGYEAGDESGGDTKSLSGETRSFSGDASTCTTQSVVDEHDDEDDEEDEEDEEDDDCEHDNDNEHDNEHDKHDEDYKHDEDEDDVKHTRESEGECIAPDITSDRNDDRIDNEDEVPLMKRCCR